MSEEIYAPPVSDPETDISTDGFELASRWARLGASILDAIIMSVVVLPVIVVAAGGINLTNPMGMYENAAKFGIVMELIGSALYILINGFFLKKSGQTIGKKLLKIRAVTLDGQLAPVKWNLVKRYGFYILIRHIPFVGRIIGIVNVLFIFNREKRCLHDLVGETKVVKC